MATIRDVAAEAQVGASTVWRVVNNSDVVRQATRERVREAIRRVGYKPRRHARARRSMRVAFVYTLEAMVEDKLGAYCREVVAGVEQQAHRQGMTVSLFRGAEHADDDPIIHDLLERRPFDGLILLGPEPHNGYLERLAQAGAPLVVFNRPVEHDRYSSVTVDFFDRGARAAEHLLGLGHRRIAKTDQPGKRWLQAQTHAGFVDALERAGLELVPLRPPGAEEASERDRVQALCGGLLEAGATALLVGDRLAVMCADELEARGVRVPEDVSVIGVDNLGLETARGQRLTATGFSRRRMGRLAIRMLRHMIQKRARGAVRWCHGATVPTRVVEGQTTAPPPVGALS